jgi:hypothetical protein
MRIFKHKLSGKHYRLVKQAKSNVNTYIEVDKDNNVIVDWRNWSFRPQEQIAIITGFNKLMEI